MEDFERRIYYKRKARIVKLKRQIGYARRRIRRLRMLIRVALIFGLLYFSYRALHAHYWILNPDDILSLKKGVVTIEGNDITPEYKITDIIKTADVEKEQIFKFSTKAMEDSISSLQSVKKAYVRRFWFPARIAVYIDEAVPVFLIAPNPEAAPISAITRDGGFIGREFMPIPSKFKTIKILSYGNQDDYEKWDKKRVDEILKFIKIIEIYSKEKVVYLDLRNKNDVYIQLEDELLRIGIFDEAAKERIKSIPTILPEAKNLKQKVKYIDLRWSDASYIKLEGESAPKADEASQNQE